MVFNPYFLLHPLSVEMMIKYLGTLGTSLPEMTKLPENVSDTVIVG